MALIAISMNSAIADKEFVEEKIISLYHKLQGPLLVVVEKNALFCLDLNEPLCNTNTRWPAFYFQSLQFECAQRDWM